MKFLLLIVLLLLSLSDASVFVSPSQSPTASPTPQPSNDNCVSVIYDMVDCLSFLTIRSTDSSPTKKCCVGVKSVVEYNPQCLCVGLESSRAMGFVLDNTRVHAMPSSCNVPIVPHCKGPSALPWAQPPKTSPSTAEAPSVIPSLTKAPTSSPPANPSSLAATAPSRASTAPSPSKSGSGNILASNVFSATAIVSSFAYVLA